MNLYTFHPALNLSWLRALRFAHPIMVEKLEMVALLKHTLLIQLALEDPASTLTGYTCECAVYE